MENVKKTLMITGASGFIGTNFIERYKDKYNIVPVDLLKVKPEEIEFKNVDTVLHLAALVHQMNGAPKEKYFEVNTELTRKVAEAAKKNKVKHFVFYSTVKVYGYDGDLYNHDFILNEHSSCNPVNDPYGESKWEAEKILREMETDNFIVSVIRPPMVYGKGVKGNMESLIKLVKRVPILPFNYTKNRRSFVNIANLLYLTSLVIDKEREGIFLPLDERPLSLKEMIEGIEEGLKIKRIKAPMIQPFFWILTKLKPNIMVRLYGSLQFENRETREKLEYVPLINYEKGIKNMLGEVE
ncbi:NAD-dependent epimerase/dehydratase family protein [Fusobacterium varium]|uniref:NAD-dependent epimerase/dehydratase family protein n=1 Tax=Fusobacterium varium TaxID=856 RepID=UPI000E4F3160|nr:NAD-dependent epimerase/dehydratase family protein [Fusobacterium varium]RHG36871.1 NAD-dependent epimerase/dehydratase family protein [Fusobacterium varium]